MKLSPICKANYAALSACEWWPRRTKCNISEYKSHFARIFPLTDPPERRYSWYKLLYTMPDPANPKRQALQTTGTFNPRADQVRHPLFQQSDFFDPQDLLQLKYETLRALEADGYSIAQAAREFALSRPTIYQAQGQFQQTGLEGLLPRKRGPHQAHKLTAQVRQYLQELAGSEPALPAKELARRVRQRFKVKLHPRTIQKALHPKAKRGRQR